MTSGGRLFQRRHPATRNARSPTVDNRVRRIASCMVTTTGGDLCMLLYAYYVSLCVIVFYCTYVSLCNTVSDQLAPFVTNK